MSLAHQTNRASLSRRGRAAGFGMLGLGIGYFLWYTPYTGIAKALSRGLLPGVDEPIGGPALLPGAVIGLLAAMLVFIAVSGWRRYARHARIGRLAIPFPGRRYSWTSLSLLSALIAFADVTSYELSVAGGRS